jgi:hypothetical protein
MPRDMPRASPCASPAAARLGLPPSAVEQTMSIHEGACYNAIASMLSSGTLRIIKTRKEGRCLKAKRGYRKA